MSTRRSGRDKHMSQWSRSLVPALRRGGAGLLLGACLGYGGPAHAQVVAGTVEQGLAELAQQIADGSRAADRTTIAVLRFPHANGLCSVLSTYVVDELILALFSQPNSQLDIIERSQLEALIAELQIGQGGILNPATTKELGNISGVNALTIGTVTVMGDFVRLNARLVATDTGRTIAAAAVTVPKTAAVSALLEQPAPCSTVETLADAQGARPPSSSPPATGQFPRVEKDGLRVEVVNVGGEGSVISVIVRVTNISGGPMRIAHRSSVHQFDNGTICDRGSFLTNVSGVSDDDRNPTRIDAGEVLQYSVSRIGCDSRVTSSTLASRIVLSSSQEGATPTGVAFQLFAVPFTSQ